MMFPIVGTIRNTVKLTELDNQWQKRKKNIGKEPENELDFQIRMFKEDLKRMRENEKAGFIDAKLNSGMGLTPEELAYLQKNSPEKYKEYLEVKKEKEAFERQVKSCKTKEDVERLKFNKMNSYLAEAKSIMNNPNIPKSMKVGLVGKILKKVSGIEDVYLDFVKSGQYGELTAEEERTEKIKERNEIADSEEIGTEKADTGSVVQESPKEETGEHKKNITEGTFNDGKTEILSELKEKAEDEYKKVKIVLSEILSTKKGNIQLGGSQ